MGETQKAVGNFKANPVITRIEKLIMRLRCWNLSFTVNRRYFFVMPFLYLKVFDQSSFAANR